MTGTGGIVPAALTPSVREEEHLTTTDDGEVSLGHRMRDTLTRNLIFTCLGLGSAWSTAHLLLPVLEQHGLAVPVIWLRDGTQ